MNQEIYDLTDPNDPILSTAAATLPIPLSEGRKNFQKRGTTYSQLLETRFICLKRA